MLWVSLCFAHVDGIVAGIDIDPVEPLLLETSFGLIHRGEEAWTWSCHELPTRRESIMTPAYRRGPSGTLLAVVQDGQGRNEDISLYRSTDGGCSYEELDVGLIEHVAWFGEKALAGTPDGAMLLSEDDGATWTPTGEPLSHPVRGFTVADGRVFTVEVIGFKAYVYSSTDGSTWESFEVGIGVWRNDGLEGARVAFAEGEVVWLRIDALGGDTLVRVEGGEPVAVLEVGADLIDVARDDAFWVLEANRAVYTSTDGTTFTKVEGPLPSTGIESDGSTVYLTGVAEFTGTLMTTSPTWSSQLSPYDITGPFVCPAESEHATVCDPLWPELEERLAIYRPFVDTGDTSDPPAPTDDTDEPEEPPEDCGCGHPGGGWLLSGCVLSGLSLMRRREPQSS